MPFGLKNTRTVYLCLVNKMFVKQLRKTMEVYIDDMLINSKSSPYHKGHLLKMFKFL